MSGLKQDTLNKHVNLEAIGAYVETLRRWADRERWENRENLADPLEEAANALDAAVKLGRKATNEATNAAYDRMYGR
jgi:hypothetical protein